jgi:2'-5' RNA ligase
MPYAIELFLDETTAGLVHDVWSKMAESELGLVLTGRAHITLGVWDDVDLDATLDWLDSFSRSLSPIPVEFSGFGSFVSPQSVVYLSPIVTVELIEVHTRFHAEIQGPLGICWSYYLPGSWVPHCTLTQGIADDAIAPALEIARTITVPISGTLESTGIVEFPEIVDHGTFALTRITDPIVQ